ncbi:MAG: zinc finger Ran-binding domain-containing protein [Candidatus Dependentiae bacterium]|nr:zinc finger Ran-binding domain-containing protein [Candidatus Dependentiae bacterium]
MGDFGAALELVRMLIGAGGRATDAEVRSLPSADRERYLALVNATRAAAPLGAPGGLERLSRSSVEQAPPAYLAVAEDLPPAYTEGMPGHPGMAGQEEKEAAQAAGVRAPGDRGWRPEAMLAKPRGEVVCPACTFSNKPGAAQCEICDTPLMAGRR